MEVGQKRYRITGPGDHLHGTAILAGDAGGFSEDLLDLTLQPFGQCLQGFPGVLIKLRFLNSGRCGSCVFLSRTFLRKEIFGDLSDNLKETHEESRVILSASLFLCLFCF